MLSHRSHLLNIHQLTPGDKPCSDSEVLWKSVKILEVQSSWVIACKVIWKSLLHAPPTTKEWAYSRWSVQVWKKRVPLLRMFSVLCTGPYKRLGLDWTQNKHSLPVADPGREASGVASGAVWPGTSCDEDVSVMRKTELPEGVGRTCLALRSLIWVSAGDLCFLLMLNRQVSRQWPATLRASLN